MRQKMGSVFLGIGLGVLITSYVGYVDLGLRSANMLRQNGDFEASSQRLERLVPLTVLPMYKREMLLKLAFNYRDLDNSGRAIDLAHLLIAKYPGSVESYYGKHLLIQYQVESSQLDEAITEYKRLLDAMARSPRNARLDSLREDLLYGLYEVLSDAGRHDQAIKVRNEFVQEFPNSPYLGPKH